MKNEDIVVGRTYLAKVSDQHVRVRVVAATTIDGRKAFTGERYARKAFRVAHLDGRPLPKVRLASALHYDGSPVLEAYRQARDLGLAAYKRGDFDTATRVRELIGAVVLAHRKSKTSMLPCAWNALWREATPENPIPSALITALSEAFSRDELGVREAS